MSQQDREDAGIRQDIAKAICRAFPHGVIDVPIDLDESYLADVCPELKAKLCRIDGASVLYERHPRGGPQWSEESDPDEDPPDWNEPRLSYCLFFVAIADERFEYGDESVTEDQAGTEHRVEGTGSIGCSVGVSLLAPFACVTLDTMAEYEDGSYARPDVCPQTFDMDLQPADMDEHVREMFDEEGVEVVHALRDRITGILESFGIAVLPDEELRKAVPWLKADGEMLLGREFAARDISVKDALFHRAL